MGQIERYGLYVLCLLIFLILGVAVWGGDPTLDQQTARRAGPPLKNESSVVDPHEFLAQRNLESAKKQIEIELGLEPAFPRSNRAQRTDADDVHSSRPVHPSVDPVVHAAPPVHVVVKDDILETISLRYLGTKHRWKEILALNPGVVPERLKLDQPLRLPEPDSSGSTRRSDRSEPGTSTSTSTSIAKADAKVRTYKVRKNDSPWGIAAKLYGKSHADTYSKRIMEINDLARAEDLRPDMQIKLPPQP